MNIFYSPVINHSFHNWTTFDIFQFHKHLIINYINFTIGKLRNC